MNGVTRSERHYPCRLLQTLATCVAFFALTACVAAGGDDAPELLPLSPQSVAVNQTLVIALTVDNPSGKSLDFSYEAPSVPGIDRVATLAGTPSGGEFRWVPLASQVGVHELVFRIGFEGGSSEQSVIITVESSSDSAPVFLRPSAGGAFDLARDPCVRFDVEIRDDDSDSVSLSIPVSAPVGARLDTTGPKQGEFEWCPTTDQVAVSERWTLSLVADDHDHAPVVHDYVAVLQTPPKEGCPGDPPVISVRQPEPGARLASAGGYPVVVDVTDDGQLRDAPLLYYTAERVDDPANPDITTFIQTTFIADGRQWGTRIPSFGLIEGQELTVSYVVSATDNDDAAGAACDHRSQSPLRSFVALPGNDSGVLGVCEPCALPTECETGICAASAGGGRCVAACAVCLGPEDCREITTTDGEVAGVCGDVAEQCGSGDGGGGGDCTDDALEDNDQPSTASPINTAIAATICPDDSDYFRIAPGAASQVDVVLEFVDANGDLDLNVVDAAGQILGVSAGLTDIEQISTCVHAGDAVFALVRGFGPAQNDYQLTVTATPFDCLCENDAFEPDSTRDDARSLSGGGSFGGVICSGDQDYIALDVPDVATITASIEFDGRAVDLDLELLGPDGTLVGASRTTTSREQISSTVAGGGVHVLRIFGFGGASGSYTGMVTVGSTSGCADTSSCPLRSVCDDGECESDVCENDSDCPRGHICPESEWGDFFRFCAEVCESRTDCRSGEECKRFAEGRACWESGRGAVGADCVFTEECAGDRVCLDMPGGYCAAANCNEFDACGAGEQCVRERGLWICAQDCTAGDDLCRLSYSCDFVDSAEGGFVFVCLPE